MPHSTADEVATPFEAAEEDTDIPDAPPTNKDEAEQEDSEDGLVDGITDTNGTIKQELKLEDLFKDDDDDDDEFPSASLPADNAESSPPAAPV